MSENPFVPELRARVACATRGYSNIRQIQVPLRPWQWGLRARALWASLFCWGGRYSLADVLRNIVDSQRVRETELAGAAMLADRAAVLRYALARCRSVDGLAAEFGVWKGETLRLLAHEAGPSRKVVGFDSFEGLPEDWGQLLPKGHFRTAVPDFASEPTVSLEVGRIEDTLPRFLDREARAFALVHIDCDIYATTRFILERILPRMPRGAVLVFDEYYGYPSYADHEHRAWREAREAAPISARPVAYSSHSCAYEILNP
jgi:hypothetical protein